MQDEIAPSSSGGKIQHAANHRYEPEIQQKIDGHPIDP
jgi:hypothetical protein